MDRTRSVCCGATTTSQHAAAENCCTQSLIFVVDTNDRGRVDAERGQAAQHAERGRAAGLIAAGVFKQVGSTERHERG